MSIVYVHLLIERGMFIVRTFRISALAAALSDSETEKYQRRFPWRFEKEDDNFQ